MGANYLAADRNVRSPRPLDFAGARQPPGAQRRLLPCCFPLLAGEESPSPLREERVGERRPVLSFPLADSRRGSGRGQRALEILACTPHPQASPQESQV